jgi:hypothetical protein
VSRKGRRPISDRALVAFWDVLDEHERRAMRRAGDRPDDWEPPRPPVTRRSSSTPITRMVRAEVLEGLEELARIMRMPPGRIAQLKESLIERVEPE